jgi:hypothetical protein
LSPDESSWVLDIGWAVSADRRVIRPAAATAVDQCVDGLRHLVDLDAGVRRYDGAVAAYDDATGELCLIGARAGRVTRRVLRKARAVSRGDNVIDLATHRRTISRRIG